MKRVAALVLVVALASCSASTPKTNQYGDGSGGPKASRSAQERARKNASATAQPHTIRGYSGEPRYGGTGSIPSSVNDHGGVATAAAAYLRGSPARSMTAEIDYVTGRRPSDTAVAHLEMILERELDKPGGIDVRVDEEIADARASWTFKNISALESRYRSSHSGGDSVTMWIVYLSGSLSGEPGTLGVAYEATGAAMFPDEIGRADTALVHATAIERATVAHEVGHLLGLVNLAVKSKHDHEDPDHPGHSRYETSVMFWAIEDGSIASLLQGGPPDDFDRYDRADLAAIRSG